MFGRNVLSLLIASFFLLNLANAASCTLNLQITGNGGVSLGQYYSGNVASVTTSTGSGGNGATANRSFYYQCGARLELIPTATPPSSSWWVCTTGNCYTGPSQPINLTLSSNATEAITFPYAPIICSSSHCSPSGIILLTQKHAL